MKKLMVSLCLGLCVIFSLSLVVSGEVKEKTNYVYTKAEDSRSYTLEDERDEKKAEKEKADVPKKLKEALLKKGIMLNKDGTYAKLVYVTEVYGIDDKYEKPSKIPYDENGFHGWLYVYNTVERNIYRGTVTIKYFGWVNSEKNYVMTDEEKELLKK